MKPNAPPSGSLEGRIALVTGAAHRLGRSLALAFADAGAHVIIHYHTSQNAAESLVAAIEAKGRRGLSVSANLADAAQSETALREAIETMGGIDILVNNVGTIVWKSLQDHSPEDWAACLGGTLFATLHASLAALPALRASGHGRIINILDADADATDPVSYATAYKIGKRGTFTLTKTMAVDEGPHGVTVNAVSPGTLEDSGEKPDLGQIPAGRYGTHADVEHAVLYLASDAAGYVTGTHIKVSGGYLI